MDYEYIDIYERGTSAVAARMYFEPLHQYTDAEAGAKARLTVRFTAYKEINEPRFNLMAGSGVIGSFTYEHTFIPVGEGSPFNIEITITDASVFVGAPRETQLGISVDTADRTFMTITPALCGITALTYRLSPVISVGDVFRSDADGIRRPDGVHGRVIAMQLERREEWSGDATAITIGSITLTPTQGQAQTIIIPTATLQAALDGDYTELIPSLLEPVTLSASENWTIVFTIGFTSDNTTSATVVLSRAWANMHLSSARHGGVAFGGFSRSTDSNPMLESAYPLYTYGGIVGLSAFPSGEQRIGTAPDGKPLYTRVERDETGFYGSGAEAQYTMFTDTSIDRIYHVEISGLINDENSVVLPMWGASNILVMYRRFSGTKEFHITHHLGRTTKFSDIVAVIWYTKTTDQAATT